MSKQSVSYQFQSMGTTRFPGLQARRQREWQFSLLMAGSAVLLSAIFALTSAVPGLSLFTLFGKTTQAATAAATQPLGQLFFLSSGQINEQTNQGIADEIELDLANVPPPPAGKRYTAWLLNDDPAARSALLLGQLTVSHSSVHFHYAGNDQHTNLLAAADRLLVTEENMNTTPTFPSFDPSTWRYVAAFPHMSKPSTALQPFSHLRQLLAADSTLDALGMPGGLDIWLLRNAQKVLEWAGSARDDWAVHDSGQMHRQLIRVLDYLDGVTVVQHDVPLATPVLVNPRIGKASLLDGEGPRQEFPSLLSSISLQLHAMIQSPGVTPGQQRLVSHIQDEISKVEMLLEQGRQDAKHLVSMTDTELLQPASLSLLDDLVKQVQDAFVGQYDPSTGAIANGVIQIHYAIERLATIEVTMAARLQATDGPRAGEWVNSFVAWSSALRGGAL